LGKKFYMTEFWFHNYVDGCCNWDEMLTQIEDEKRIVLALKEMEEKGIIVKEGCDSSPSVVMWNIANVERFKPYAERFDLFTTIEPEPSEEEIKESGLVSAG